MGRKESGHFSKDLDTGTLNDLSKVMVINKFNLFEREVPLLHQMDESTIGDLPERRFMFNF